MNSQCCRHQAAFQSLARGLLAPQVLDRLLSADAMTALGYTKLNSKD